jgi:hypothetical protein
MQLLSPAHYNTKTAKTSKGHLDFRIVTLALSPADESGHEVCANRSKGCSESCVSKTGLGAVFPAIQAARRRKTQWLFSDRQGFLTQLKKEIESEAAKSEEVSQVLTCRLNCFSDLPFFEKSFGEVVQFVTSLGGICYDYSRFCKRRHILRDRGIQYHLCYSWDERPQQQADCLEALHDGCNVSIAFGQRGFTGNRALLQALPKRWKAPDGSLFDCVDGDRSDLRIVMPGLDPGPSRSGRGRVIALRAKSSSNAHANAVLDSGFAILTE